jgi:branched-chain amino acid transport system substrate-binding protein
MSPAVKRRRLVSTVVASVTALAMLTACGGSSRVQSADTATQSAGSTADKAPATGAAPAVDAPVAAVPAAPDASAPKTDTSTTTAANAPAATTKAAGATEGAKPTKKAKAKSGAAPTVGTAPAAVVGKTALTGRAAAIAAAVTAQPIFGGAGACKPATLSPVAIGNVSTLSGVLGQLFAPVVPALKTFVASQNACGGLSGHPIKFFIEDDQDDPSTAAVKANSLIKNEHILAFMGNIQVLTDDAIVTTVKRAGIPVIGMDLTNNTWYSNPLFFPQGSGPQATSYGYMVAANNYFHKKKFGHVWCIEVPQACTQIDNAVKELAPQMGVEIVKTVQVSLTAPSFTTACLDLKSSGADIIGMTIDAASQVRMAKSCSQVGYHPAITSDPLSVGNEKQFFGEPWLGNDWVPIKTFPWMASDTPALKYYQEQVKKFIPGFTTGDAASLGWSAGALLVAAGTNLSANPTTQELLDNLYSFKGQAFTRLGGLTAAPLTFREGGLPKIPYCVFSTISNADNSAWASWDSKGVCTDLVTANDPQKRG